MFGFSRDNRNCLLIILNQVKPFSIMTWALLCRIFLDYQISHFTYHLGPEEKEVRQQS